MNTSEYASMDSLDLGHAIRKGELTKVEVLNAAIAAIEKLNPKLNAVVMKNFDNARRQVDMPAVKELQSTVSPSPIDGVPFLLKDVNVFSQDMPTTFSCAFFKDAKPKHDSDIVKRWKNAGLVILGRTNTPEFAEDFVCESTFRGPALNPWNVALTTGGSSGGAGAAVASRMVPMAHGTDLGGSIRIPAACCGVFGLKPTTGLNPVDWSQSEIASGFNSDHVLTRSVRDNAAALDATAMPILGYRYPVRREVPSFLAQLDQPLASLKIGVCCTTPTGSETPTKQQEAVEKVSEIFAHDGHELVEYAYPKNLDLGGWLDTLWMVDVANEIEKQVKEMGREPLSCELEAMTKYLRERIAASNAMDLYAAREQAHKNSVKLMTSMRNIDLLLTPALGSDPIKVGAMDSRTDAFDYQTWTDQGYGFAPYAYVCNITGQPAASLPVQLRSGEMPCAVQLAGHHGKDHLLLQAARIIEEALEWDAYRPPICANG